MPHSYELIGVAVVAAGALNPAIFHPHWFATNGLLPQNEAEHALEDLVLTPQLTAFTADWLTLQVTPEQAIFSTVEEAHELELRDLARGVLDLLPHTPIDAMGLNADAHYRLESEDAWHAVGDRFVPKDPWEALFQGDEWRRRDSGLAVGVRSLRVEAHREDRSGYVRIEVAPSVRVVPWGVYVGVNNHYQLTDGDERANGYRAARTIDDRWDEARDVAQEVQQLMLEAKAE